MIKPFATKIKDMDMKIKCDCVSFFPKIIKVMYLDWELYNQMLVCITGSMLSLSNYKNKIDIQLSYEKNNTDSPLLSRALLKTD